MHSSLEHPPVPDYRIPINVTIDGQEQSGYLRPVDTRDPCQSYMVWIGEKWIGTIHHFNNGWHVETTGLYFQKIIYPKSRTADITLNAGEILRDYPSLIICVDKLYKVNRGEYLILPPFYANTFGYVVGL